MTAGAYGIGTAVTVAPIEAMIRSAGYAHTFVVWGIIQGIVVMLAGVFIIRPPEGWAPAGWIRKEAAIVASEYVGEGCNPGSDVAALAAGATGSWIPVFWSMVICSALDAILALVLLKPLARRTVYQSQVEARVSQVDTPGTEAA